MDGQAREFSDLAIPSMPRENIDLEPLPRVAFFQNSIGA